MATKPPVTLDPMADNSTAATAATMAAAGQSNVSELTPPAPAEKSPEQLDDQYAEKYISTCYGLMVNPHSGIHYDRVPQPITEMDGWVKSQIEDKKMEVVDAPALNVEPPAPE